MGNRCRRYKSLMWQLIWIFSFSFMHHSHFLSYIRISLIWILIGVILQIASSWMSATAYPASGIGAINPKGSLFVDYFQNLLEDTNIVTTDGMVKNSDKLGWALPNLYQRRVNGTCNVDNPITKINADGSVNCTTIYRWKAPTGTGWSSCIPNNTYCGTNPGTGTQTGTVTCTDNLGNIFPDAKCLAAIPALIKPSNIQSCNPGISCDCTVAPWWVIPIGNTVTGYSASSADAPITCASISQPRTCTNTLLSGTNPYQSCINTGPYSYTAWSTCSKSCGGGTQSRTQSCSYGACHTPLTTSQSCNTTACPIVNWVCNPAYDGGTSPGPYTWASVQWSVCTSGMAVQGSGFPNGPWTWQCVWSLLGSSPQCSANLWSPTLAMCSGITNTCLNGGNLKAWSSYTIGDRSSTNGEDRYWTCEKSWYADDWCIAWPFCYSGPTTQIPCP